jgi:hypothetical protein
MAAARSVLSLRVPKRARSASVASGVRRAGTIQAGTLRLGEHSAVARLRRNACFNGRGGLQVLPHPLCRGSMPRAGTVASRIGVQTRYAPGRASRRKRAVRSRAAPAPHADPAKARPVPSLPSPTHHLPAYREGYLRQLPDLSVYMSSRMSSATRGLCLVERDVNRGRPRTVNLSSMVRVA